MANTKTTRVLKGGANEKIYVLLFNLISDGTEETDLVIFDNSAVWNDVSKGSIRSIQASGSDCVCMLKWDQTTDSPIANFNPALNQPQCYKEYGGISNPNGTGATGDLLLSTANLDSGDAFTLIVEIWK